VDEQNWMKRRITRGLILLGAAVAVVATPLWMSAQQQPQQQPVPPAAGTPPVPVTQPDNAVIPPTPGTPGVGTVSAPTTGPLSKPPATQMSVRFKDAPIDAVLQELSAKAGYAVIKTVPLDGRVTVWNDTPVSPERVVELLNSLLKDRGYTAVIQGRVLKVGLISEIKKTNVPVHISADPASVAETDEIITQVIPVRSVDAVKLKTDLQPLVSANADLSANGGSNSVIITDTSANVRRIVEIISNLDKHDAQENDIIVQHLVYADATATAKLITDIFQPPAGQNGQQGGGNNPFANFFGRNGGGGGGGRGGGAGGGGGGTFAFGGPGGGGPGGGGGGAAAATGSEEGRTGTVTASADTRTNTIVVTGPKDTLDLIKDKILSIIDKDPVTDQVIFTYKVKNGQAVDMAATLNTLFGASITSSTANRSSNYSSSTGNRTSTGFGNSSGGGGGLGGTSLGSSGGGRNSSSSGLGSNNTGSSQARNTGGGGSFGGGGSSSGGTATGPAADLIGQVEAVADADTNSLLVVTATRFKQQVDDIIAQLDRPVPQVEIKVLIAEVTHDRSDDLGLDFSILNSSLSKGLTAGGNFGNIESAAASAANGGGGGLSVNLVERQITTNLHALAVAGKLDVLSRPYILTSDNQEATILVGQEVPYVTNTRVDTLGGTTSTIQYQDIGILLDVTPHINQDGLVVMDVAPQISSFSEQTLQLQAGVSSPVFNQRSASSHVGVRDGATIVIGGLMQDQKTMTVTKIPLLGDIPYLGLLFQRDQVSKTKTELLIFLTPHVALMPEHLTPMSVDEMKGVHLTPGAVQPGTFQEHIKGMQLGGSATQPALPIPPPEHDRDAWEPEPKMP